MIALGKYNRTKNIMEEINKITIIVAILFIAVRHGIQRNSKPSGNQGARELASVYNLWILFGHGYQPIVENSPFIVDTCLFGKCSIDVQVLLSYYFVHTMDITCAQVVIFMA